MKSTRKVLTADNAMSQGETKVYMKNPMAVKMVQMSEPFTLKMARGQEDGVAGDFIAQGPTEGDVYIITAATHYKLYAAYDPMDIGPDAEEGFIRCDLDIRHQAVLYPDGRRVPLCRFKRQDVYVLVPEVT